MGSGMKVSVVTVTRNDGELLRRTVDSVYAQRLSDGLSLEHIIVNGNPGTYDGALRYAAAKGSKIIDLEPAGCYNAINYGLRQATGDVLGLLHGTDFYHDDTVLKSVAETLADESVDFVFGDVVFVRADSPAKIRGVYSARTFTPKQIKAGFAPPHPSLFIRRRAMERTGLYKENYRNAADFDYFVRLFNAQPPMTWRYIPRTMVRMERGGASATFHSRLITNTLEKRRALIENGFSIGWWRLFTRYRFHFKIHK